MIENFLSNPEENGISSVKKYLPAFGLFSTVLALVGNLVVTEKTITTADLNEFIARIQQIIIQYEKLNAINEQFAAQVQKLLEKTDEAKEDLRVFLVECINNMNASPAKQNLKDMKLEVLIQK